MFLSKLANGLLVLSAFCVHAQDVAGAGVPVHMVVTVEGKHDGAAPALSREDVIVQQKGDRRQVTDWVPLRGDRAGLQLWILIDDAADASLAGQYGDLKKFIEAQPGTAQIGIGYMRNGTVQTAQELTTDHDRAARALRIPSGIGGGSASPYMSLSDLIKHWPEATARREVLMITSGIDLYYGPGPENPYLLHAIDAAQRAGVIVHSIYYGSFGHFAHSTWQITWGQNDLAQICEGTGGEAYWQGFVNPVSLAPFLDDLTRRLNDQYALTFLAFPGKKSDLQPVRLNTEVPHATLVAAARVWVPAQ